MKKFSEIAEEIENSSPTFLTVEMIKGLDRLPAEFVEMKREEKGKNPQTSYSSEHDGVKIDYLLRNGIQVPEEWYKVNEGVAGISDKPSEIYNPSKLFHAEIVTAAIVLEKFRDIFSLLKEGLTESQLQEELQYHIRKLLRNRVNDEGDRDADVTGRFAHREARMKSQGISCNPNGRLTIEELALIRDMILKSYRS